MGTLRRVELKELLIRLRLRSLSWFPKTYLKVFKRDEGQCGTVLDHTPHSSASSGMEIKYSIVAISVLGKHSNVSV